MSIGKTDKQFREEVEKLTGDEYTVLEEYKTNATKINFKHNICGYVFPMAPVYFLNGNRCPFCARAARKKTNEQFQQEVKKFVGDDYTFLEPYVNSHTKLLCRHNSCGNEWKITPSNFLRGYGCPKCATDASRKTNTQFLQEVKKLTGDEYTFLESYVNYSTKLLCRHNSCGNEWKITPDSFLHGSRCPKCAGNMKKTPEQFFQEVKKLVGDEYVFLEPYINNSTKLLCRHNACGYEWEVTPGGFLFGRRCPKCAGNMKKLLSNFSKRLKNLSAMNMCFWNHI